MDDRPPVGRSHQQVMAIALHGTDGLDEGSSSEDLRVDHHAGICIGLGQDLDVIQASPRQGLGQPESIAPVEVSVEPHRLGDSDDGQEGLIATGRGHGAVQALPNGAPVRRRGRGCP